MVIRAVLNQVLNILKSANVENAVFEANLIVRTVFDLSPIDIVLSYKNEAQSDLATRCLEYANRRAEGEPLQYILGVWEFMGLEFSVNPDVLIPRADTETLVETLLKHRGGMNLLDICSGSGCIALSAAHYNKNIHAVGLDISTAAITLAEKNAEKLNLNDRVRFLQSDIMSDIPSGIFDVIVSNPPYIKHNLIDGLQNEVKLHEPHIALDGGADGLDFYRRIVDIAPRLLCEYGELYFEIGYDQADEVSHMMSSAFTDISVIKDLGGNDRVVFGKKKK